MRPERRLPAAPRGRARAGFPDRARDRAQDAEVIVVGGGPAGSATAILLAEAGHRVLLLDKARFPRHKACSEYVNAGGVRLLARLGVLEEALAAGAHCLTAMRVHAPHGSRFVADFAQAAPGEFALGLSRYRLDHLLLARARTAGVDVHEQAHVREVVRDEGRVAGVTATINGTRETLRAAVVVGADGHHSAVRRALGLATAPPWPRKTGLVAHFRGVTGLTEHGEMHVGDGVYAGLAPLEDGLTNVAVVAPARVVAARPNGIEAFFGAALDALPEVAAKLATAERAGGIRGVGDMAGRARRPAGDSYLLVGDAAGFLDPFTGDGIHEALRGAALAAPVIGAALRAGDCSAAALAPYVRARRRAFAAKHGVTWVVQGFINVPPLMDYVTARLGARDALGLTLAGVLGNTRPATQALSPVFLARLLRP